MHTQNRALRRINDRGRHQRTEYTTIRDGESTTGQILYRKFAIAGFISQRFDTFFNLSQRQFITITQNRSHQAPFGRYRNADVEVIMIKNIIFINRCVNFRIPFQRLADRFDIKRHKPKLDAMPFFKLLLILATDLHNGLHVDLIKGGQHSCGILGFQQAFGDAFSQTGHRYPFFFPVADWCAQRR